MSFGDLLWKWIKGLFGLDLLLDALDKGEPVPAQAYLNMVYSCIVFVFGVFLAYKSLYVILGLFGRSRKYKDAPKDKRYCFLIPARNEELVIGNLIDSIHALDYPQENIGILIVADNCDPGDKTAEIARSKGAMVVERHDMAHRTLGFALQYAFQVWGKTHDIEHEYYAYIRFDADNVVPADFLTKMNNAMQNGHFDEAVAYRNAKNLGENWIAAMCGMNVYTHPVSAQRARSILKTFQEVYGPGACFRSYLLKDGWNWTGLTEDLDIEADLAAKGYKTGYAEEAQFYEEEPTKVKLFIRQQMRWTKGGLLSFQKYSWPLMKSFFKKPTWNKYDMYWQVFPYSLFSFFLTATYQIISLILMGIYGEHGYSWASFGNWIITFFAGIYVGQLLLDIVTIIREWDHFHLPLWKTFLYVLLFPIYQIVSLPFAFASVFMKVQWKHIDHHYVIDPKVLVEEEEAKKHGK